MCFDPLSATALVLAADRSCGCSGCCGCRRGNGCRPMPCACRRSCACMKEPRCEVRECRENDESGRRECEEMADRRAEERMESAGCGECAVPRPMPCNCDVVRPAATCWSPASPSRRW